MIPQVIHYCWFGGKPLPELAERCIASWREQMPHCDIIRWDENNFDVNQVPYTAEAYRLGKYAYVSDYARLWILYRYGGIYLDTDVELLRPLDDMMEHGAFMGQEQPESGKEQGLHCAMGLGMACEAGNELLAELLRHYEKTHYVSFAGRYADTIVDTTNRLLATKPAEPLEDGLTYCCGFRIYPSQYLCPLNYFTGQMSLTPQTHAIHHYAASWLDGDENLLDKICRRLRCAATRLACQMTHVRNS